MRSILTAPTITLPDIAAVSKARRGCLQEEGSGGKPHADRG